MVCAVLNKGLFPVSEIDPVKGGLTMLFTGAAHRLLFYTFVAGALADCSVHGANSRHASQTCNSLHVVSKRVFIFSPVLPLFPT